MLDVTILHGAVPGASHQEATACFQPEDKICSRCDVWSLRACKHFAGLSEQCSLTLRTRTDGRMNCQSCNPSCLGTCFEIKVRLFEEAGASVDGDHLCRECDGTGWVLYRSETKDGEFEEAHRLCPEGHTPRYCMGSSGGHLCHRPATARCGPGYYCEEHIGRRADRFGRPSR